MLRISIYNEIGDQEREHGSHRQVKYFVGAPDLKQILEDEKYGNFDLAGITETPSQSLGEATDLVQRQSLASSLYGAQTLQDTQRFRADDGKILILSKFIP